MSRFRRRRGLPLSTRLYAWWWWRSPNRPHVIDDSYRALLDRVPEGSLGLDLGSRARIRPDAITLDVIPAPGVDVVGDGHELPWPAGTFDYVWCNAVLEHVRNPFAVAAEITRTLKPGGLAIVQVPFLENVHGWPDDYFRFTPNGLRMLFPDLEEIACGTSAGPGQVLPDIVQYYATAFAEIQQGGLFVNLLAIAVGALLLPIRVLDRLLRRRPSYWKWARAYYFVARKPTEPEADPVASGEFVLPGIASGGFDEIMRLRARDMVDAFQDAGIAVRTVDEPTGGGDFVTAPNLNYLLVAAARGTVSLPPRILLWDDPLGALALVDVHRRGGTLGSLNTREDGVHERMRSLMSLPGDRHFAWDSGHVDAVAELDLLGRAAVEWYPIATYPPFLEQGRRTVRQDIDVAFCGNVYESALTRSSFNGSSAHVELAELIARRRIEHLDRSIWETLRDVLAELPDDRRRELGLYPDCSTFWDFYLYAVWLVATTTVRVELLSAVEREVRLFGVFADPESVTLLEQRPNLVYGGHVSHYRELPRTFARTKVNVCVANGLIYQGVPSKLVDCVASGGFALTDPKADLVRLFGDEVEAIVFRSADELNEKIEYFLARPRERREIVETLRGTIERECTLRALSVRIRDATK